jgi:hypothetical protein
MFSGSFGVPDPFGPRDRQVFVSKSGQFPEFQKWMSILESRLGKRFNLISDDDFRPLGGDGYYQDWTIQFRFTRASYAMLVLLDLVEWTSRGQDIEIEDAMGRGMPVALCRTASFTTQQLNQRFRDSLMAYDNRNSPRSCLEYFDFCEREVELELSRLDAWVNRFAVPPLRIPNQFVAGQPEVFRVTLRTPNGQDWEPVDWSLHHPLLVFNYGSTLVQHGSRIPRTSAANQIIVPLLPTEVTGEITAAQLVLPSSGSGHVVLTIGPPADNYAWDDGGLNVSVDQRTDIFLWWDFFVRGPQV